MADLEPILRAAVEAVRRAAQLCRSLAESGPPSSKPDRSPVTVADFASQAVISRLLSAAFPDIPIVAEEEGEFLERPENAGLRARVAEAVGDRDAVRWIDANRARGNPPRFWALDPVDGTKGFLRGGQYAIALALVDEGRVEVAAMACPNLEGGAVFSAVQGRGAVRDGADPIRVSGVSDPADARIIESFERGHSSHEASGDLARRLGVRARPIRMDSQAKYAVIASGDAEILMRAPTRPGHVEKVWDHAAGFLIAIEAGGRATDLDGRELNLAGRTLEGNRGLLVTNGLLHETVLKATA